MCRKVVWFISATLAFSLPAQGIAEPLDYLRDIKPVLRQRCYACHGALKQNAGLRLDTAAAVRKGGEGGPAVLPGKAGESPLIARVTADDLSIRMPPEGKPLTSEQIASIKAWIEQGAAAPQDEQPEQDPRQHWSFQPPVRPEMPSDIPAEIEAVNAIDRLIHGKLREQGLTERPPADKAVVLRRVYLDLIGVPPRLHELQAFLADDSPGAYESVVDRLLADPRYGERWGRHWMDIWRYSDWYGRRHVPDVWNSAPQLWRWRDWIVRSLNADKGYDRMVQEMLAEDEICPEDADAGVATGYLIRNWYALNPNDWMRNIVEHTGKAFLGLTFNCAHCHDHKYDPITQEDYFRLRAFFEPIAIRQDRVPGEADPGPFQEYNYSTLRKVQRLGAVRIFDKSPEAPTWFYTGGDERNRVKERGSVPAGVPDFISGSPLTIESVPLPRRAWYPGLQPAIQDTMRAELRTKLAQAESNLATAKAMAVTSSPALQESLSAAQLAFDTAARDAEQNGQPRALAGRQSLLLNAATGRRALYNALTDLKGLEDDSTIRFQLLILKDAHVNFQLAKHIVQGLTAGYVGFDAGKILAYRPGSFAEFEAGRYDFSAGQSRMLVTLTLQTKEDRCLLSVRSLKDDKLLVDGAPLALNGWNPVGDATKGITFDARPGSVAVIDDFVLSGAGGAPLVSFDFEQPQYVDGRDVIGIQGWGASTFSVAPATSTVSTTAANESLARLAEQLRLARSAAEAPTLPLRAAEARITAIKAEFESLEARIAAERAKHGETPGADLVELLKGASQLQREAGLKVALADALASERSLAAAQAKPETDQTRAKAIQTAMSQLAAAQAAVTKAQSALGDPQQTDVLAPLTPVYPQTSTGRRRALALWITSRRHPLTARVAANHIWARHFHAPLVATVHDFGRSGAPATNQKLLDYLAVALMESGWSMKRLHRLIVTSQAYQRTTAAGGASQTTSDPENKWLWRMNAGRMEAEVVRDSLLYLAQELDLKMGGQELENSVALTTSRRSLYYSVFPEEGGKSALGELFDAPDALECYRRTRSIIPQQALALTNSELVHRLSAKITADLLLVSQGQPEAEQSERFVTAAFQWILSRAPTPTERQTCNDFLIQQAALATPGAPAQGQAKARESLVRALLNHNDFITIR